MSVPVFPEPNPQSQTHTIECVRVSRKGPAFSVCLSGSNTSVTFSGTSFADTPQTTFPDAPSSRHVLLSENINGDGMRPDSFGSIERLNEIGLDVAPNRKRIVGQKGTIEN